MCLLVLCFVICMVHFICLLVFFFKQKTAYEMRISDWSSDVCSSDLHAEERGQFETQRARMHVLEKDLEALRSQSIQLQAAHDQLQTSHATTEIGRASCRERVCQYV